MSVAIPVYSPPCDSCGQVHSVGLHVFVCPRCTHEHRLPIFVLAGLPIPSEEEKPYKYFAVCPVVQQPILFRELSTVERAQRGDFDG